jgi:hypothetical protein
MISEAVGTARSSPLREQVQRSNRLRQKEWLSRCTLCLLVQNPYLYEQAYLAARAFRF